MLSPAEIAAAREGDGVNYECPNCEYDGSGYKNGAKGWVDATNDDYGDACGSCGGSVNDAFQCERCSRWLSGDYHSANDCNGTWRGVCLCGDCGRAVAAALEKQR